MSTTVKINQIQYGSYVPRPKLHKKAFYKIFSPKAFKLKPMESITLNLKINIIWAEGLTPKNFDLYPTLKQFGLSFEETNWKLISNTGITFTPQTELITVTILNKNCTKSFNIKKHNLLFYFLLPYTNHRIITDLLTIITTNLLIRISHHSNIMQPDYLKNNNSVVVTSPVDLILEPRSDAWIDLKFNIKFEETIDQYEQALWLKPSTVFGSSGLDIEDKVYWFKNVTKNNTIQLHLFNRSFYYKIKIKKHDIIGYGFLLGNLNSKNVKIVYEIKKD